MGAHIHIHRIHRQHTGGLDKLEVNGNTIGACIRALINRFPGMQDVVLDENGKLHDTIELYLNMQSAYPDTLKIPVTDGDTIHIALLLVGG
jgi:sulfur-carrier protein